MAAKTYSSIDWRARNLRSPVLHRHRHPLNVARGIAIAGLLSTLFWCAAALVIIG